MVILSTGDILAHAFEVVKPGPSKKKNSEENPLTVFWS